jgi:hypothetical protein
MEYVATTALRKKTPHNSMKYISKYEMEKTKQKKDAAR